ncbi:MAG: hypothetical protein E7607_06090 [Ruminococcaceae bacterium]|nr:hypothetical protein [Oscillospiraceae bacterium]
MKRILAAILVVVLALSSMIILSSCGAKPKLDLEKAKDNLEAEKYSVSYDKDVDEAGIEETLTAYKDDDGLVIMKFDSSKLAKLYYKQLKLSREQEKESKKLNLEIYKFMIKEYEDKLSSDEIDDYKEEIDDIEKELKDWDDYVIGKSGKTVWAGSKDAVKASKG